VNFQLFFRLIFLKSKSQGNTANAKFLLAQRILMRQFPRKNFPVKNPESTKFYRANYRDWNDIGMCE
jgi:hypothetical protein